MQAPSPEPPRILVVDDDEAVRNVLCVILAEEGYRPLAADTAESALHLVRSGGIDLVVADVRLPGQDGLWLVREARGADPDTAIIVLTGYGDTKGAVEALRLGAVDYLLKPPKVTGLVRAVERALARRRIQVAKRRYQKKLEREVEDKTRDLSQALKNLQSAYETTLAALVAALDAREHETGDHSQRVVCATLAIARRLGVSTPDLEVIKRGALLHDVGKIGTPDAILLKPGPLTAKEWEEMRRHPQTGYEILSNIPFLSAEAEIVLSHQERWDGTGYPRQLRGEQIPLGARVFAIADTVDAMTSDRCYRRATTFEKAQAEVKRCAGTQFDPEVVEAFLSLREEDLRRAPESSVH